jgi:hypothetical protein
MKTKVSIQRLIDTLELLRNQQCAYCIVDPTTHLPRGGKECDCKYRADEASLGRGESGNGCPELRETIGILKGFLPRDGMAGKPPEQGLYMIAYESNYPLTIKQTAVWDGRHFYSNGCKLKNVTKWKGPLVLKE